MKMRLLVSRKLLLLVSLIAGAVLVACQSTPPPTGNNQAPVSSFTASTVEGEVPLSVTFDASGSHDPDGTVVAYAWRFGDGGTATDVTAAHSFVQPGHFTVELDVRDDDGATATSVLDVTVLLADGSEPPTEPPGENDLETASARAAIAASTAVPGLPDTYLAASVDAALAATQLTGSATLVYTGTVTQTGPNSASYDPSPADRLRAVFLDGGEYEIVFTVLQGDFSGDGSGFLDAPHRAAAQVTSNAAAGSLDLEVQSLKLNGDRGRLVRGGFTDVDGVRWVVDARTEGTYVSEADIGTARYESDETMEGTLAAAALGLNADLQQRYVYKMLNGVENVRHEIAHAWTWDGSTYRFEAQVFVAFDESRPVDTDQWVIAGSLTRDGTAIGQVAATDSPQGLDVTLDLGNEQVPLFHFSYL